ncbi:MAG: radical SAM protein, partial [Candidatus Thorarchaeota archaeon]|nr:radical SAM protein [Candidatus Thorarchaeota archaeon]
TEPTIFFELAYDTAKLAKTEGLYNTFVTNGYMTTEAVETIAPYLDAASVNFKGSANKEFYKKLMDVPKTEPIFNSMERMKEKGVFIEITNLIIPEVGDNEDDTRTLSEWVVEHLGPRTPFHFTSFSPTYKMTNLPRTSVSTLERHISIAKESGLEFVYSGNVPGHDYENTYCPNCGFKAVERYSVYLKNNNLREDGKCPKCGTDLGMAGIQWMRLGKGKSRFL